MSYVPRELTEDSPVASCCGKPPVLVTTLTVVGATGLEVPATSKVKCKYTHVGILSLIYLKVQNIFDNNVNNMFSWDCKQSVNLLLYICTIV